MKSNGIFTVNVLLDLGNHTQKKKDLGNTQTHRSELTS